MKDIKRLEDELNTLVLANAQLKKLIENLQDENLELKRVIVNASLILEDCSFRIQKKPEAVTPDRKCSRTGCGYRLKIPEQGESPADYLVRLAQEAKEGEK